MTRALRLWRDSAISRMRRSHWKKAPYALACRKPSHGRQGNGRHDFLPLHCDEGLRRLSICHLTSKQPAASSSQQSAVAVAVTSRNCYQHASQAAKFSKRASAQATTATESGVQGRRQRPSEAVAQQQQKQAHTGPTQVSGPTCVRPTWGLT